MVAPLFAAAMGAFGAGLISVACFGAGVGDIITKTLYELLQSRWFTAAEILRMYQMGIIDMPTYREYMKGVGFTPKNSDLLRESTLDGLNVTEIIRLWFRFRDDPGNPYGVSDAWTGKRLTMAGIRGECQRELIEAERPVPTLQDVITFAIRDVYEPEQVEAGGLLQGVPEQYLKEARERGLTKEDAEKYWAAHWNLPGITQVYEMLHRLYPGAGYNVTFTDEDMDKFFNLADIAPGYRERLKAISYNPLTRVDIRRMYAMGQYGEGETARAGLIRDYRQIGYNPYDANRLATFTIRSYGLGRKKFTQAQVLKFYKEGLLGEDARNTAIRYLGEIGYDADKAGFLLDAVDLQQISSEEQVKIDLYEAQWINGTIKTEAELRTLLAKISLSQDGVEKQLKRIYAEKRKRETRLTRSEADNLYRLQYISEFDYRKILSDLGYPDSDIDLIIQMYGKGRRPMTQLPTKEELIDWYNSGILSEDNFVRYLRELGYPDQIVVLYAEASGKPLSPKLQDKLQLDKEWNDYDLPP